MIDPAYVRALEAQNRLLRQLVKVGAGILVIAACLLAVGWKGSQGNDLTARVIKATQIEIAGDKDTKLVLGQNLLGDPFIAFYTKGDPGPTMSLNGTLAGRSNARILMGASNRQYLSLSSDENACNVFLGGDDPGGALMLGRHGGESYVSMGGQEIGADPAKEKSIKLKVGSNTVPCISIKAGERGLARFGDLGLDGVGYTVGSEKNVRLGGSMDGTNAGFWLAEPVKGRTIGSWASNLHQGSSLYFFNSETWHPTITVDGEHGQILGYKKESEKAAFRWPMK